MIRRKTAKKEPWVKRKPRQDLSLMSCCIEARQRAGRLVLSGCMVCGRPAEIHHIRNGQGMSQRAPWWETIPLCREHHQGRYSTHGADRKQFHEDHGTEREMLDRANINLPENLRGPKEERT